jgi:hypothetical protein
MGHTGDELAADCLDLWEAGYYELKPLGEVFRDAAGKLVLTDQGLGNMYRDGKLGGPYGPVHGAWSEFRDDVFDILRETAEALDLTGDALVMAAKLYMGEDEAVKAKFEELQGAVIAAHPEKEPPR